MIKKTLESVFGTRHSRELKRIQPILAEIREHGDRLQRVSEEELRGQTEKFRGIIRERTQELDARIASLKEAKKVAAEVSERDRIDMELTGADGQGGIEEDFRAAIASTLDEILPEAFATVREGARRLVGSTVSVTGHDMAWDMVHYDVQLIGGTQLHLGRIAEMATGEGKTLVATLPLYLNALPGRGAHLVTVNSYLARRDSQWMGHLFKYLGLTVACLDDTEPGTPERRAAYHADITYGTNNEFGFDYLRDNMVVSLDQRVQRPHIYAIVDEVDSVLVDEARTPLIISGPVGNESDGAYAEHSGAIERLVKRQGDLVNNLVAEAEKVLGDKDDSKASLLLFKAQLGGPKNKRLLKVLQEQGVKQMVQKMELAYLADRKLPPAKQEFRDLEDNLMFVLDERGHSVHLTDQGVDFLSPGDHDQFVLPDLSTSVHRVERDPDLDAATKLTMRQALEAEYAGKAEKLHIVHQLLRAHALYEKDVNYVVQEGQVLIVDEFTGRTMHGRRWSEGLHQAVEAKERVQVKGETQTLATITIQNYFRMYEKLSGMTGTAETEETEFFTIYKLVVSVIPTNKGMIRKDKHDLIYKTRREKYNAIVEETKRLNGLGFPVLVGTASVDVSETLSRMFKRAGIEHNVLNAKYHQREAEIVAGAGQPSAVTIATNMAGRGTDIKLGAGVTESRPSHMVDPATMKEVDLIEDGGLHIIGSERHESRRIDRQLRGRAGRQGDPGASQFFLSLEDDLMRLFGTDRIAKLMDTLGAEEGEVLTHPLITRSIEQAQKRVELQNFQARKRLLEYDDVMNQQREVIYNLRAFALEGGEELKGESIKMLEAAISKRVETSLSTVDPADWDLELLSTDLVMHYLITVDRFTKDGEKPVSVEDAKAAALEQAHAAFERKLVTLGEFGGRLLALVMLNVIDEKWKDHLYDLDQLRSAIHYRSWGQKDPLVEYKQEAYSMFVDLMNDVQHTFTERFLKVQVVFDQPPPPPSQSMIQSTPVKKRFDAMGVVETGPAEEPAAHGGVTEADDVMEQPRSVPRQPTVIGAGGRPRSLAAAAGSGGIPPGTDLNQIGRNDPCPCGSGKKFKKCHGVNL